MKVYVHEKGIILTGKGWEILQKLKEYNKEYATVSDWINENSPIGESDRTKTEP